MTIDLSDVWNEFQDSVLDGIPVLAENVLKGGANQAKTDVRNFLEESEKKLKLWGDALSQGKIDRDDFEFLVGGQASLLKMHHLKQIGILQGRLESFRIAVISLLINSAFSSIGL